MHDHFLNLSYCASGYLVFCYSYVFLLKHYFRHKSSYSSDKDKTAVIQKLAGSLPSGQTDSDWTGSKIFHYKMLLEAIGQSAETDGNWQDIEDLFFRLLEVIQSYGEKEAYIICVKFYQLIYWRNNYGNRAASLQVLKRFMEEKCITSNQWPILWGLMKLLVCGSDEKGLEGFLQWFLDLEGRSAKVCKCESHALSADIIDEQAGAILILLEYRLREQLLESSVLEAQIYEIWILARTIFLNEEDSFYDSISILMDNFVENDSVKLEEIFEDLKDDYCKHTKKSLIANIVLIDGDKNESRSL